MRIVVIVLGSLVVIFGFVWLVEGNDFFLYKTFAPKREAVRREVYEESLAYNKGIVQELDNMRFEYIQADPEHKSALRSIILHRASAYPSEKLTPELRSFIEGLRSSGMHPEGGQ